MSKDIKEGVIRQTLKQNLKDLVVGADELKEVDKDMKALEQPILYRNDDAGRLVIDSEQMLEDFTQSLEDFANNEAPPIYKMSIMFNGGGRDGENVSGDLRITIIQDEDEDMDAVRTRAYEMVREACMDIDELTDADGNEVEGA